MMVGKYWVKPLTHTGVNHCQILSPTPLLNENKDWIREPLEAWRAETEHRPLTCAKPQQPLLWTNTQEPSRSLYRITTKILLLASSVTSKEPFCSPALCFPKHKMMEYSLLTTQTSSGMTSGDRFMSSQGQTNSAMAINEAFEHIPVSFDTEFWLCPSDSLLAGTPLLAGTSYWLGLPTGWDWPPQQYKKPIGSQTLLGAAVGR